METRKETFTLPQFQKIGSNFELLTLFTKKAT